MAKAIISAFDAVLDAEKDLRFLAAMKREELRSALFLERWDTPPRVSLIHIITLSFFSHVMAMGEVLVVPSPVSIPLMARMENHYCGTWVHSHT